MAGDSNETLGKVSSNQSSAAGYGNARNVEPDHSICVPDGIRLDDNTSHNCTVLSRKTRNSIAQNLLLNTINHEQGQRYGNLVFHMSRRQFSITSSDVDGIGIELAFIA